MYVKLFFLHDFLLGFTSMWPKGKTIDDPVVIDEKEGGLYKLKGQPEQALVHDSVIGIEDLHMCTIEHYHLRAKLLKVFQKYRQNMTVYAKDVRKERTQRRHFQVARAILGNHPL